MVPKRFLPCLDV